MKIWKKWYTFFKISLIFWNKNVLFLFKNPTQLPKRTVMAILAYGVNNNFKQNRLVRLFTIYRKLWIYPCMICIVDVRNRFLKAADFIPGSRCFFSLILRNMHYYLFQGLCKSTFMCIIQFKIKLPLVFSAKILPQQQVWQRMVAVSNKYIINSCCNYMNFWNVINFVNLQ